jgi:hypothetical protein
MTGVENGFSVRSTLTLEQFQESAKNKTYIAPKLLFQATDITNGTGSNTQSGEFDNH